MHAKTLDSMSLKIQSFLQNTGVQTPNSSNPSQLIAYFEREYDLKMMRFLEKEWISEQIERDLSSGSFAELRAFVSEDQLNDFDDDVASLNA
ncbi:MAG: hypothetical protein O3B41_12025 [Bacteroidetes bacterium]|nr:hypothetical protein [Bacteroidota bacterium]